MEVNCTCRFVCICINN